MPPVRIPAAIRFAADSVGTQHRVRPMSKAKTQNRTVAFISHAGVDMATARTVEKALASAGVDSWLDDSDINVGALLRKELRGAIEASQAVVLLWSKAAAASRWVAAELLMAFHLDRFVVPCVLQGAPDLPQFLSGSVFLKIDKEDADALRRLCRQVQKSPRSRNELLRVEPYQDSDLKDTIRTLVQGQRAVIGLLDRDEAKARDLQRTVDVAMRAAEAQWPFDPTILNLAGYHRKNGYMVAHWAEYCAGRFPKDPLLAEAERFFFDTLFVNPNDYSALNGIGNVLLFEGELQAAEFFVRKAIDCAAADGVEYGEAKHDLQVISNRSGRTAA
jgi:hypothetical protein